MILWILGKNPRMHHKCEFYEFDEFCWHFELRARFDNQENHIWREFGDIEDPKKTPGFTLIMIFDLRRQIKSSKSKIKYSRN